MTTTEPLPIEPQLQRRIRLDEYHRMIGAGVFDEDARLELIDGVLLSMSPQGLPHARAIQRLTRWLIEQLGPEWAVRPQLPLSLDDLSEPEPDLAVVTQEQAEDIDLHPTQAALVIEVASDSLRKDRLIKTRLYARSGIQEYWIINVQDDCVEVYADPDVRGANYRSRTVLSAGDMLRCASLPGVTIDVAALLHGKR